MAQLLFTDDVLPQLREWCDYNLGSGCTIDQLKVILVESGYRAADVDAFLGAQSAAWSAGQTGALYDAPAVGGEAAAVERLWQRSDVLGSFNAMSLGDRTLRPLVRNPRHGIHYIPGFLSHAECDSLIRQAAPHLSQSAIVDETDGAHAKSSTRTSQGTMLASASSEVVRRIESRIAKLTALPVSHGEDLQILRYDIGGEYRPHCDFFDPQTVGGAKALVHGSQRLATVIMYLCDVEGGGCTQFPELGLEFTPMKGAALLFACLGREGNPLETSLHWGRPVTSGEKWIATKWLRVAPQAGQAR